MKHLAIKIAFLFILFFNGSLFGQGTGYVRLEGKQFIDHNGNPFYPLLMNWKSLIQTDGTSYYPSTYHSYGPGNTFECQNVSGCSLQILNQFNYIRSMGFNGIRLSGLYPHFNPLINNYELKVYDQSTSPQSPLDISNPANLNILLSAYKSILDIAANVSIQPFYVIINTGGQDNTDGLKYSWTSCQPKYMNFLTEIGNHLKNEPLLMAYDFYNEPCYHVSMDSDGVENKEEACNLVSDWVDAIRIYDLNHLTTIGNCWDEVMRFDPACLKIDFNSPHFYPLSGFYGNTVETSATNNPNYQKQIDGILYWLGKNMPLPWIVGETGFTANDNAVNNPTWQNLMNGTESAQADYANSVLQRTYDCEASGFSWWNFQDYNEINDADWNSGHNYFGILKRDIATCPDPLNPCQAMNKPAASVFSNFGNNPLPQVNSSNCVPPLNYYDPYNHLITNASGTGKVDGIVTDQDGNPIGDALVYGWGWLETETEIDGKKSYKNYPFYTFTNADPSNTQLSLGEFEIRPFNYKSPTVAVDQRLTNIWFTGLGLENKVYGDWQETQLPLNTYNQSLRRINFGYDGVAINQTVSNSQRNLRGGESLTVKNSIVTSTGISEITAKKNISLDNFRAELGSYVHIYTSDYDHCFSYDGLRIIHPFGEGNSENYEFNQRAISLNFNNSCQITLHPNPANNFVQVQLKGFQENSVIRVLTPEGKEVGKYLIDGFATKIGTSRFKNGMYILIAADQKNQLTTKFIVTH